MLESVPKGVLEKPLPSLPEADDVAKIVKSTRRQFRYAVTDDDLLIVLQGIDDLFGKIESGEDEIRVLLSIFRTISRLSPLFGIQES